MTQIHGSSSSSGHLLRFGLHHLYSEKGAQGFLTDPVHQGLEKGKPFLLIFPQGVKLSITPKADAFLHMFHILKVRNPLVIDDLERKQPAYLFEAFLPEQFFLSPIILLDLFRHKFRQALPIQCVKGFLADVLGIDLQTEPEQP